MPLITESLLKVYTGVDNHPTLEHFYSLFLNQLHELYGNDFEYSDDPDIQPLIKKIARTNYPPPALVDALKATSIYEIKNLINTDANISEIELAEFADEFATSDKLSNTVTDKTKAIQEVKRIGILLKVLLIWENLDDELKYSEMYNFRKVNFEGFEDDDENMSDYQPLRVPEKWQELTGETVHNENNEQSNRTGNRNYGDPLADMTDRAARYQSNTGGSKYTSRNKKKKQKKSKRKQKKTKKTKKRKWSMKYKKSINCKKPKGFSQKQYCKFGRKKKKGRTSK